MLLPDHTVNNIAVKTRRIFIILFISLVAQGSGNDAYAIVSS